jgi:hypothetical protein
MNRTRRTLVTLAVTVLATVGVGIAVPGAAEASGYVCGSQFTSGSVILGSGNSYLTHGQLIRFRAERTSNNGYFEVTAITSTWDTVGWNAGTTANTWVGRWSSNYPSVAAGARITNSGASSLFYWNSSCLAV